MGPTVKLGPFVVGKHLTVLFPCDRENYLVDVVVGEMKTEAYRVVSFTRAISLCATSASHPNSSANERLKWHKCDRD